MAKSTRKGQHAHPRDRSEAGPHRGRGALAGLEARGEPQAHQPVPLQPRQQVARPKQPGPVGL